MSEPKFEKQEIAVCCACMLTAALSIALAGFPCAVVALAAPT